MLPEIAVILSSNPVFKRISADLIRRGVLVCRASSMEEAAALVRRIPVTFVVVAGTEEQARDIHKHDLQVPVLLLPGESAAKEKRVAGRSDVSRNGEPH